MVGAGHIKRHHRPTHSPRPAKHGLTTTPLSALPSSVRLFCRESKLLVLLLLRGSASKQDICSHSILMFKIWRFCPKSSGLGVTHKALPRRLPLLERPTS